MRSNKMRVLVISHGHPSFSIGGAEVASYNLFQGLNALPDCESHYLARIGPPVAKHKGTHLLSLRQKDREMLFWANDYDHFRLSNRNVEAIEHDLVRYIADVQPDVIHFHHFLGLGVECVHAIRQHFPGLPIVVTLHEYLSICHHHGQMVKTTKATLCQRSSPAECSMCFPHISAGEFMKRELFLKTFFDQVDHFVSPSQFLIERYVDWGLPREKCTLLENGLVLGDVAPPRPVAKGGRRCRFGYFGQVTRFKGVHVLLDAITRVPDSVWGEDASVAFFGGNLENQPADFQADFTALMERAGRRARFYGSYRAPEIGNLMKDIDYVIVPSIWWENSPIVIQEAFAHGRPVICSNIGGMAEKVRSGVDGLHFRVGSTEDLVDRFVEVLREPQLWDQLRAKIRRPLSYQDAARQHQHIYRGLVRGRQSELPQAANG
jgi:glycosyltransferase involved in cell wall biosynthesis